MLYHLFLVLLNCLILHNNVSSAEKNSALLMRLEHTFGIKTEIYYNFLNEMISLTQSNNENQIISKMRFQKPIKDNIFCTFVKKQKIGKLSVKINVKYKDYHNLKVHITEKKDKAKIRKIYTITNLYNNLEALNNINICVGPNYDTLSKENSLIDSSSQEFYETYYKMIGINKKNTPEVSFNDTKTYTMGDILGTFGVPTIILFSGDGCETLIYTGLHKCDNHIKFYFATMVVHCDVYSKVIQFLYHVQLCPICHANTCIKSSSLQVII
jgi:hypothetical protein